MSRAKDILEKLSSLHEFTDAEYANLIKQHRDLHDDQDWHDYVDWVANQGNEFPDNQTILDKYSTEMGKQDDVYNKLKSFVPLLP
ncbi:hypothetical protein EVB32_309 [Rhizobium phage RHph_TM39]|uniref:Uncharacterized protein n=2 Tax=Cuauhnahuacvirus TaxID=3044696 RepID=A0A7S5R845_9CAUD|nr:hypothetical protein PQC16_gp331 [Rhizobium phage RHph_TM30]YP_010671458.1 hypothetical protein PQC17_gp332 [Rhizobium phage RHph_Y65]QIG71781.1 hypothetical protein EVB94_330 [Rhizobium phage RHph_TM40]QIG72142.1 hypothetical protein EVB95_328 [Rhizobium phage RHph_TM2_3B]QIG72504.1 hypothetical protein EVB96_328 [Rhizobium phage RHph_TM3_3_6]QIG77277.1 hypothetical protein EVB32_309 [Rhizobium phage RHph_TM39]QIG77565.1 hypothetical protein EVB61_259 [Rhizobium phage RHph_TM21B]QIG77894